MSTKREILRNDNNFYDCFIKKFIKLNICEYNNEDITYLLFDKIIKDLKEKEYNINNIIENINNTEEIKTTIEFNNKNFNIYVKNIFCLHEDYLNTSLLKILFIDILIQIYYNYYNNIINEEKNIEEKNIKEKKRIYDDIINIISQNIYLYIIIILNHENIIYEKYLNYLHNIEEKEAYISLIRAIKLNTKLYKRKLENNIDINNTCNYIKNRNTKNWTQYLLEFIDIFFNKDDLIDIKKGGLKIKKIKKIKKLRKYI